MYQRAIEAEKESQISFSLEEATEFYHTWQTPPTSDGVLYFKGTTFAASYKANSTVVTIANVPSSVELHTFTMLTKKVLVGPKLLCEDLRTIGSVAFKQMVSAANDNHGNVHCLPT